MENVAEVGRRLAHICESGDFGGGKAVGPSRTRER